MNTDWQRSLESHGAHIVDGVVQDFGDPAAELEAARSGSVLADLSHLAVLEFSGADAEAFLHGQLSCDARGMNPDASSLGSYCTPKGRMLADFLLWRVAGGYRMALSRTIAASIQKRLRMYVLRSKVQITDASDAVVLLGAAGPAAPQALGAVLPGGPQADPKADPKVDPKVDYSATHFGDGGSVIALPGARYLIAVPAAGAARLWSELAARLRPVGTPCWEWLDIHNGFPLVTARTQEQFVPQMVNLELIGGVNFNKGCYPGQEIVARTQYLGKVKRRMFLAHLDADVPPETRPEPGEEIFSDDIPGQASGMVVNAQPSPTGGYDLLAVVQLSSREASVAHLRSSNGPVLRFLDLPYAVS